MSRIYYFGFIPVEP